MDVLASSNFDHLLHDLMCSIAMGLSFFSMSMYINFTFDIGLHLETSQMHVDNLQGRVNAS
jgi:hypothetical protein